MPGLRPAPQRCGHPHRTSVTRPGSRVGQPAFVLRSIRAEERRLAQAAGSAKPAFVFRCLPVGERRLRLDGSPKGGAAGQTAGPMASSPPSRRLVLASASPARRRLLVGAGFAPEVIVSGVDEDWSEAADLPGLVTALAGAKAEAVAARPEAVGAVVVGCDSLLDVDGTAHGKPAGEAEARARLRMLRGRSAILRTRGLAMRANLLLEMAERTDGFSQGTLPTDARSRDPPTADH